MALRTHLPNVILNTSLKKYLLLNIVSGGLYFYVIQHRLNGVFTHLNMPEHTQSMKNSVIAMWSSLGMFIGFTVLVTYFPGDIRLIIASLGFFMFFIIMQIVWAFQCRYTLMAFCRRERLAVKAPNLFFTLFIPGVVLVRSINRLHMGLTR